MTLKSACVIGAGASGLAAVQHLYQQGLHVTCLEARSHCGGTWVQDESDPGDCIIEFDERGIPIVYSPVEGKNFSRVPPTAIYDGLRTNLHKKLMENRYHQFPRNTAEFPPSSAVFNYLESQSKDLEQFICYNRFVQRIYLKNGKSSPWVVESVSMTNSTNGSPEVYIQEYDHVVLANGHYSEPKIPPIRGFSNFNGVHLHARWYRNSVKFTGKNCIVVGQGPSGVDVARELAIQALKTGSGKIYASTRNQLPKSPNENALDWYKSINRIPEIIRFEKDEHGNDVVLLEDDTTLENIDVIIWATGYYYSFPFASPKDYPFSEWPLTTPDLSTGSRARGNRAHNLDLYQLFYLPEPSLAILGLQYQVVPFPLVDVQARAIARIWKGDTPFILEPSPGEEGEDKTYHHYQPPKEFDVQDSLLHAIGEGGNNDDNCKEIDDNGKYLDVAKWRRDLRKENSLLRAKFLGY